MSASVFLALPPPPQQRPISLRLGLRSYLRVQSYTLHYERFKLFLYAGPAVGLITSRVLLDVYLRFLVMLRLLLR
ncbi:hypothetical protein E2C01_024233 [Portunus trituberculatus]|uniref:Uncharacterized protein n=1 Tax=Portunus trituberculatus TaxID=210409 RepID=A0A5B7EA06_PORTR|nr:hypothetical protein [Portunus trituberculatus]